MFGISAPCAHDWENEFQSINDMEVAHLQNQIDNDTVEEEFSIKNNTLTNEPPLQERKGNSNTNSISAGEITQRINNVTKPSGRVVSIEEEHEEDEKMLLARLAAIRIEKRKRQSQASQNQAQGTSKPRQPECSHIDAENGTLTMTGTNSAVKISDLMSVSQLGTD
tara:strand:+ start:208 stop:705 length:498 start_codon:yes stop_codon:yes gene_type:complete